MMLQNKTHDFHSRIPLVPVPPPSLPQSYSAPYSVSTSSLSLSLTLYTVLGKSCRGIDEIRPHIEAVDDVPLLVPLFSGCTPASTASMIDIMQEHGRVVCCFGSSMNSFNAQAFAQADMSVAFDPLRSPICFGMEVDSKPLIVNRGAASAALSEAVRRTETTAEMIAAHFNTIPCSFCVSRDVDFSLSILIRESRRLSLNFRQCFSFLFYGQGTLSLVNLLSQASMLPPIMNGLQVIWLILVPLPLVAASLLATPAEQGLMGLQTSDMSRKDGLEQRVKQYSAYFALRAVPTLCSLVALFMIVLRDACEKRGHESCHLLLGNRDRGSNGTSTGTWNGRAGVEVTDLVFAQNVCCWMFVLNICITSCSMIHRSLPFRKCVNRVWFAAVGLAMLLQSAFFAVCVGAYRSNNGSTVSLREVSVRPCARGTYLVVSLIRRGMLI